MIKKSNNVELPGGDETRSVEFNLMIRAWLHCTCTERDPALWTKNYKSIIYSCPFKMFNYKSIFLKTNCTLFTYSTKLYKKKNLKRLKQSDNIHCVLRHKLQTVVIRILKKKSHCADRKSHITLLQFTVSRNEING